jgi:hypothetical protein
VVTSHARAGEAGKAKLGCLLTLLIVVALVYYGIDFGRVQFRYYQIQDQVKQKAAYASVIDDATIRRQLAATADSLGLPLGTRDFVIRRLYSPKQITISATYVDSVVIELPGVHKVFFFTFKPQASNPF